MSNYQDWVVAVVIATEVPPKAMGNFFESMIPTAIQAVSDVIRNRVASPLFPNTPVEVVLQKHQFSAVCSQDYWVRAMAGLWQPSHVDHCLSIWQANNAKVAGDALYYYSPVSMNPPFSQPTWLVGKTEVIVPNLSKDYFRFYK